jgi:hypothetical protein
MECSHQVGEKSFYLEGRVPKRAKMSTTIMATALSSPHRTRYAKQSTSYNNCWPNAIYLRNITLVMVTPSDFSIKEKRNMEPLSLSSSQLVNMATQSLDTEQLYVTSSDGVQKRTSIKSCTFIGNQLTKIILGP